MNIELDYLKKLAKLINDNSLKEITLKDNDIEITLKKDSVEQMLVPPPIPPIMQPIQQTAEEIVEEVKPSEAQETKRVPITSPMVGSFYASSSPNAKPFVKVGDVVAAGQVVCIIEAMKLMNEIETEVSGKIVEICVEDGQSVEYGQVLMYVE